MKPAFGILSTYFEAATTPGKALISLVGEACFDDTKTRYPEFLWNVLDEKRIEIVRTSDFAKKVFRQACAGPGYRAHMQSLTVEQCRDFFKRVKS